MLILALIYLTFISLGLPESLLGSSWPFMTADFRVPVENAGYISMLISLGTIVSTLFSHRLVQKRGVGKIVSVSATATAAALFGFSLAPSFLWLLLFALPLGLGNGAVDSALNAFVAENYEARHMNWLHSFWGLGTVLSPALVSVLTSTGQQWRSGYKSISLMQFALAGVLFLSLPLWQKHIPGKVSFTKQGIFAPLRSKGAALCILVFFLYAAVEGSMILWGASFLVQAKGLLPHTAAGWASLFFLGMTAGRMLSGFAAIKLSGERLMRLGIFLIAAGLILLALPTAGLASLTALVLIGLGVAPIFPTMLHLTPLNFGKEHSQAAVGFQMACGYVGASIMPPLLGQFFARISFKLLPYLLLACTLGMLAGLRRLGSRA